MTNDHRIKPKIYRMYRRPKKIASNARITRESFGNQSRKILSISLFIDDYNHYMGGVDQANQLRAAFTTHFSRNQKKFFPETFWTIDLVVCNSYKLHLTLNDTQTSSTGKRDPTQQRKWIEDLINLLIQVKNDDFGEEITSKLYLKYVYQTAEKGSKPTEKETFLKAIDGFSSDHLYDENPLKRKS